MNQGQRMVSPQPTPDWHRSPELTNIIYAYSS